jgi:hypothetical protein
MRNAFRYFVRTAFGLTGAFFGLGLGWTTRAYGPYTVWRYSGSSIEERCKEIRPGTTVDRAVEAVKSGSVPTDEGLGEGMMFFSSPTGTCEIDYAKDTKEITQVRFVRSSVK